MTVRIIQTDYGYRIEGDATQPKAVFELVTQNAIVPIFTRRDYAAALGRSN